tara:strand:- start:2087 stop:2857 length:771 start_codon:yes stop_codon:yes gene_type:complete
MHDTSFENLELFVESYFPNNEGLKLVDIGSRLRTPEKKIKWRGLLKNFKYIGVDLVEGENVDIILDDPYAYPFEDNSVDVIIANSIFEHSEFFWELFLELLRILKPTGILYINAPSNGDFHRGSFEQDLLVDVYRFYPDSGKALEKWGIKNNFSNLGLVESYTFKKRSKMWNDYVAIYIKDKDYVEKYPDRIINNTNHFYNGYSFGKKGIRNYKVLTEDHETILSKKYLKRSSKYMVTTMKSFYKFIRKLIYLKKK